MKRIISVVALAGLIGGGVGACSGVASAASEQENQAAIQNLGNTTAAAATVGSLVGTGVGAVGGCVIGGLVIPAVGCIPGAVTGAGIGAVVGTVVVAGPAAVATGVELYNTYQAAPGTTRWAASK